MEDSGWKRIVPGDTGCGGSIGEILFPKGWGPTSVQMTFKLSQRAGLSTYCLLVAPYGRDDALRKCLLESSENKLGFLKPFILFVNKREKAVLYSVLENVYFVFKKIYIY